MKKSKWKTLGAKIKGHWDALCVKLGFKVLVAEIPTHPRRQPCPKHPTVQMKRVKITDLGAFYHCHLCRRDYHLQGGGKKLYLL